MRSLAAIFVCGALTLAACTTTGSDKDKGDKAEPAKEAATGEGEGSGGGSGYFQKLEKNTEKEAKKLEKTASPYADACKADIEKFCKLDKKEAKATFACLKKNKEKLAPTCKAAIEKVSKDKK